MRRQVERTEGGRSEEENQEPQEQEGRSVTGLHHHVLTALRPPTGSPPGFYRDELLIVQLDLSVPAVRTQAPNLCHAAAHHVPFTRKPGKSFIDCDDPRGRVPEPSGDVPRLEYEGALIVEFSVSECNEF